MLSSGASISTVDRAPRLILHQLEDSPSSRSVRLFSLSDQQRLTAFTLPSPSVCVGSGSGLLILADRPLSRLSLYRISTRDEIPLPDLQTLTLTHPDPLSSIFRCTLVRNPKTRTLVPFLFLNDLSVFFADPNGDPWIWKPLDPSSKYLDVSAKGDEIVAVRTDGAVCIWSSGPGFPSEIPISFTREPPESPELSAVPVEQFVNREISFFFVRPPSSGDDEDEERDIWRVKKEWKDGSWAVKVHRVDSTSLVELTDLGGSAVFIGGNSGFAVDPREYRELKRDCVYFAERCAAGGDRPAVGVYSLKDGRVVETMFGDFAMEIWPQPSWCLMCFTVTFSPGALEAMDKIMQQNSDSDEE